MSMPMLARRGWPWQRRSAWRFRLRSLRQLNPNSHPNPHPKWRLALCPSPPPSPPTSATRSPCAPIVARALALVFVFVHRHERSHVHSDAIADLRRRAVGGATNSQVLKARLKTTGVVEHKSTLAKNIEFRSVLPSTSNAIIFPAPVSAFN
ncbi:hypothetical protein V8D89_007993 [Ganoderma adspersum]